MSFPLTPPAGGPRPDPAPAAPPLARADVAAVSRVLAAAIRSAAVLALGEPAAALPAPAAGASPAATASALAGWLLAITEAAGAQAAAPALLAEGYENALEVLARSQGAIPDGAGVARTLRELVQAALVGQAGATPRVATAAEALEVLAESVRAAVVSQVGSAVPPLPPATELAAAATALLGWIRGAAAVVGLPPAALAAAVEAGIERAGLLLAAAGTEAHDGFARAKEQLLAAVGSDADVPLLPFRPDFGLPAAVVRRNVGRPPLPAHEQAADEVPVEDDGEAVPAGPDLQGPMELVRRYFADFHGADPAAIAAHFVLPAGFFAGARWSGCADRGALEAYFAEARAALRAAGVTGGRILMLRVEPLADRVATVFALMTRESATGDVLEELEAAYTTVRVREGWRIAVTVRRR